MVHYAEYGYIFVPGALDKIIMLFRRRKQASLCERISVWFWPRRSFSRSFRYMGKRVLRIPATPHAVALGLAVGIFSAFTPLYGLHIILAVMVGWLLSANMAAAAIGTAFANPLTIPLIFSAIYALGRIILNIHDHSVSIGEFFKLLNDWNFAELWIIFSQLFVGSIVLGSIAAVLVYMSALKATRRFRSRRNARFARRVGGRQKLKSAGNTKY
ncbi:MAG: hypothetical protein JSC189_000430 [Candidatus Tokpelaia sp. JSC189]|nr:MAG: hypothetical protein JSC189_000430 [Candidatus Tokpelaia sp. JSC189]